MNIKHLLKSLSKPVKRLLFDEIEFDDLEKSLMVRSYLYGESQQWIIDNLNMSQTAVTCLHKRCLEQIESYFGLLKYNYEHGIDDKFLKYFYSCAKDIKLVNEYIKDNERQLIKNKTN